mgnify:FL=1
MMRFEEFTEFGAGMVGTGLGVLCFSLAVAVWKWIIQ